MTDDVEINRRNWDERAAIHARDTTGDYMLDRFRAGEDARRNVLQLFRPITPGTDLCHSRLKPFRSETEAELPLLRVDVDEHERSGFELL